MFFGDIFDSLYDDIADNEDKKVVKSVYSNNGIKLLSTDCSTYQISKTDKKVYILLGLPGIEKKDIKVKYRSDILQVEAINPSDEGETGLKILYKSFFPNKKFNTRIYVNSEMYDINNPVISYRDGLLSITYSCKVQKNEVFKEYTF